MNKLLLVFGATLCLWQSAWAANEQSSSPHFDNYYTVNENKTSALVDEDIESSLNPFTSLENFFAEHPQYLEELKARVVSLLTFVHHKDTFGDMDEPYNRLKHFGTWIVDQRQGQNCMNTRAKVLLRDSSGDVTTNAQGCTVLSGTWDEPYVGKRVKSAKDIQIDHFVPLKNAYISGAWKWNYAKRCLYANFMGNDFHLLAVDGDQNMKKGDKTPEGYMPPNTEYSCRYIQQWLKVKLIWNLAITPPEKSAIESLLEQNHCDLSQFTYSQQELRAQRNFMDENIDLCQ